MKIRHSRVATSNPAILSIATLVAFLLSSGAATAIGEPGFQGERCAARSILGSFPRFNQRDVVVGDGAVVVLGPALGVVDTSDESRPQAVSVVGLPNDQFSRIEMSGVRLYAFGDGVCALSFSDPLAPAVLGYYEPLLTMYTGDADGTLAVVSTEPETDLGVPYALQMIDMFNPLNPIKLAERGFAEKIIGIEFVDSVVYAVTDDARILVLSTDPADPFAIENEIAGPAVWENGSIKRDGNRLLITTDRVWVYDISDPLSPALIDSRTFEKTNLRDAFLRGDRLFTASEPDGLGVIDTLDASLPLIGRYLRRTDLIAIDEHDGLICAVGSASASLLRIDDPVLPIVAASPTEGPPNAIAVSGDFVYAATVKSVLDIVDVSDPAAPIPASQFITTVPATDVAILGDLVYITAGTDIQAIDVSDPFTPTSAGTINAQLFGSQPLESGSQALVVRAGDALLSLYQANGSAIPDLRSSIDFGSPIADFRVSGTRLFTLTADGLVLHEIADPTAPIELGETNSYTGDGKLAVDGDQLFLTSDVTNGSGFLYQLDVSDPSNITELRRRFLAQAPTSMVVYRDRLWINRGTAELQSVKPLTLFDDITVITSDQVTGFDIRGGIAFIAAQGAEIEIIELGDCPPCLADLAPPSPILDLQDLIAFIEAFISGGSTADVNRDEVLDLSDITTFVSSFAQGCD